MSAARELARSLGAIYVGCRLPANDERLPRLVSEIDAALADARREGREEGEVDMTRLAFDAVHRMEDQYDLPVGLEPIKERLGVQLSAMHLPAGTLRERLSYLEELRLAPTPSRQLENIRRGLSEPSAPIHPGESATDSLGEVVAGLEEE